jgi:hypothetical protein
MSDSAQRTPQKARNAQSHSSLRADSSVVARRCALGGDQAGFYEARPGYYDTLRTLHHPGAPERPTNHKRILTFDLARNIREWGLRGKWPTPRKSYIWRTVCDCRHAGFLGAD